MQTKLSVRLRALRKSINMDARVAINKINNITSCSYSIQSLYKWEQGNAVPDLKVIMAFAKIYHCHVSYLIEEKQIEYKKLTAYETFMLRYYRTDFLFRSIAVQIKRRIDRDSISI